MIPRSQHFGDRAPFPNLRSGIVRIFQETLLEALLLSAGGRAHYPGKQPHASIEDNHGPELAGGEHIIAKRYRLDVAGVEDPLVETLEPAAEKDHALARRKLADASLCQRLPARRERQDRPPIGDAVESGGDYIRAQHHPRSASRRSVVDTAVLVGREVADLD